MKPFLAAIALAVAGLSASMAFTQPAPADCVLDRKMPDPKVQAMVERCIPIGMSYDEVEELFARNHLTPNVRKQYGVVTASMPGPSSVLNWLFKVRVYFTIEFDSQGLVRRRSAVSMGDFF